MADSDLDGVPFYPGGRVPDGWTTLIEDIASQTDASAQEVAESIAESAIERIYDSQAMRDEEEGVRDVYKQMLYEIRVESGRQGLMNVRRSFGNIVNNDHSAFIDQQDRDDGDVDIDPDRCQHVKDDGQQCGNTVVDGSDYCHIESHG